jgi:DNA-binding LacI/PurR family transcriptional regulator
MTTKVTLQDIADSAGVSAATVSRVINGKGPVSDGTRERVFAAAEALEFQTFTRRRTPTPRSTRTIAVVLNHLDWPVVPSWLAALHHIITGYGYNTIVAASEGGPSTRQHCLSLIAEEQVDGAIFYSPHGDTYGEVARLLGIDDPFKHGRGLFCIDVRRKRGFHVLTDEMQIGRIAASHIVGAGARQIAVIGGPSNLPAAETRTESFLQSLEELGHSRGNICVEHAENWNFDGGYSAMDALVARNQQTNGLFVTSDNAAIGALRLLHERRIPIAGRMVIVSVDNLAQSAYSVPSLTSIDTRIGERAEIAVSELMHLLEDETAIPRDISLGARLVVRESSQTLSV